MGPTTGDIHKLSSKLYDELVGTCDGMPDWVTDHEQEADILEAFDQDAFLCAACGWWCEMGECEEGPDGDDVCSQCAEE
ncbi:hypothetical protein FDH82_gp25 [Roseobacter phage RDJL Phi 2]|uniref:Uncharacterized protein n=1 Tax=Roseobacter phage RDJL Phi 2 TaxID=1682380 RepID=A0A0K0PVH3_9CAUD|nr:hypothetical protein FDH82_gp25 [Roseobacter phage RDJL Phi 2]AKQ75815.1 hypothetical protein RDJLphi2_gp25 [Roseobacter phage RDJL Phi 2]